MGSASLGLQMGKVYLISKVLQSLTTVKIVFLLIILKPNG